MENITEILQYYGIFPQAIVQISDRVFKIKANGKEYALKRSRLSKQSLKTWLSVYQNAARQNLYEIIPVYLTQQKQLYVEADGENYYLTPWIPSNHRNIGEHRLHSIYKQLGRIHLQTKSMYQLGKKELVNNFQAYKDSCKDNESRLLAWVEKIEQTHYPSPIELQVLTHFRDLRLSFQRSQSLVDQIIYQSESETNWGISLNHGNMQLGHLFEHYIINWERASYKHAIYDLVDLFHDGIIREPQVSHQYIESFPVYMEENPLNRLEQCLLSLYLLNSNDYIKMMESYHTKSIRNQSHIRQSMELEQMYRMVVFGLNFDAYIERNATGTEQD
ncbi:phosphotransferase [Oceanobacillus luteolus]|uniref:Phosphotransferase n=1 Tax=Oceanobacillus luteolus TaxID=1274358 RepID=A0ABW4HQJ5_9BACI|nr:phosphotransferase [Oceanobacillus luteolus]MCM3739944.1 phosphotransferase [Oceanobacillus luteolus]